MINFDDLASGTVVNNNYAGVTFSTNSGDSEVRVFSGCCSQSDPNSIAPEPGAGFNFNADLLVSWSSAINNLTFYIGGDNDAGTVGQIDVFGTNGLLGTVNLVADGDGAGSTEELQDLSAFANVISIHIRNVTDFAGLVYDTFSFDTQQRTPEPSPLALAALAAIAMSLAVRRRKRK